MTLRKGVKVKIVSHNGHNDAWNGQIGRILAIGLQRHVSGHKVKIVKEYIVQFSNPKEWSWFTKKELKKL